MAAYAINLANRENWKEQEARLEDGTKVAAIGYLSPPDEEAQIRRLASAHAPRAQDFNIQSHISLVIDDPARSSPQLAEMAVEWAKKQSPSAEDDALKMRDQNVLAAAMIAMRDGSPELRTGSLEWAIGLFKSAGERRTMAAVECVKGFSLTRPQWHSWA